MKLRASALGLVLAVTGGLCLALFQSIVPPSPAPWIAGWNAERASPSWTVPSQFVLAPGATPSWQAQWRWEWERRAGPAAIARNSPSTAAMSEGLDARQRLTAALLQVHSASDWRAYQSSWLEIATGLPHRQAVLRQLQDPSAAWARWGVVGMGVEEFGARLRGASFELRRTDELLIPRSWIASKGPRASVEKQLAGWEDVRRQTGALFLTAPASWGAALPHVEEGMLDANLRLSRLVRWNGPVLGLAENIGYRLGDPLLEEGGLAGLKVMGVTLRPHFLHKGPIVVALSDRAGLDPVVHEWWHASSRFFRQDPAMAQSWAALQQEILSPQLPDAVRHSAWQQARAMSLAHCARAFGDAALPPAAPQRALALSRWGKFGLSADPDLSMQQAWLWKEDRFLAAPAPQEGPWRGFAHYLQEGPSPSWIEKRLEPFVDYFAVDEEELMARAFERQAQFIVRAPGRFGYRPVPGGICVGYGSVLIYPTSAESAHFNASWQRFFSEGRPWWVSQRRDLPSP